MLAIDGMDGGGAQPRTWSFLMTDIEGSTRLLRRAGAAAPQVIGQHHAILQAAVADHGGIVRRTEGDSFFATFDAPADAVRSAVAAQRRLSTATWPVEDPPRVRMGIHTGEAVVVGHEFVGLEVHRAARIMSAAWGGQVLVSEVVAAAVRHRIDGVRLRELGTHRLKDLPELERLHQVVAPGLRAEFPALRGHDTVPHNLPTPVTSFIGRRREVEEVADLLRSTRLLTLTGPGGTGKSRLSVEVSTRSMADHPDGVFFVALAGITDPDLVMSAVAATLGLATTGAQMPLEQVCEHLADQNVLIVLDNFEQVLAAAPDVAKVLGAAPNVRVLVTSRAPLHVSGEHEYPVPPLPLPAPGVGLEEVRASDAAALFVARASATRPDFELTEANAAAIEAITRRLDGLPLALELAAARVRLLPVEAIADRLGDVLDLASGSARDLPDRQRTLRGAIAWSHDLLEPPLQRLFARMSVFRGGMELEHLEQVCAPTLGVSLLDGLAELVDHSLLRPDRAAPTVRFAMLETIREYAAERLADGVERDDLRRRHATAFLELARTAAPELTGPDAGAWLDRLERDHDNLRAALRRSVEDGETAVALELVASLWRLWQIRGHLHEGRRNVDLALALPDTAAHPLELAGALEASGGIAYWQADLPGARRWYALALEQHRALNDDLAVARGEYNLGFAWSYEHPDRALEAFTASMVAYEALGDAGGVASAHWAMATAAMWKHDLARALDHVEQCIPTFRSMERSFDLAWALHIRGIALYGTERFDEARAMFEEALRMFVAADDSTGYYLLLADFAFLAEGLGDAERAMRLFGAVDRIAEETGSALLEPQLDLLPRFTRAVDVLPPERAAELRAEGRAMPREAALAYALGGG